MQVHRTIRPSHANADLLPHFRIEATEADCFPGSRLAGQTVPAERRQTGYRRSIISFLISAIALAGFRPLGQVLVQFMIVWQR